MTNTWKVQWEEEGSFYFKKFFDDNPKDAVEFGKNLKRRGILVVDVISTRKAYGPSPKQEKQKQVGQLWCPYCVKYRSFEESATIDSDGLVGPTLLRCPTCTISIYDHYVRNFNWLELEKYFITQEIKRQVKGSVSDNRKRKAHVPSLSGRSRRSARR